MTGQSIALKLVPERAVDIPRQAPLVHRARLSKRVLGTNARDYARELVQLATVKLFEMGRLSSGQAAKMAGISRVEFLTRLRDYQVSPFQMTAEELHQDVLNA